MNLHSDVKRWRRHRRGGIARFPMGQPGDPPLVLLPPHLEELNVQAVVGSVDRHAQLDRRFHPYRGESSRLRIIRDAMKNGALFPPIEVYRLHGACYVIDGHHRVAAALQTGQLYLDALVTECALRTDEQTTDTLEEAHARFGLRTGLRNLAFGDPIRYHQALSQIHEHRWYLGERGRVVSVQEAARDWYEHIFQPVIQRLIGERLIRLQTPYETGDLYMQLCDLKYGVSRERGCDIGFAQAIREWAAHYRRPHPLRLLSQLPGLRLVLRP